MRKYILKNKGEINVSEFLTNLIKDMKIEEKNKNKNEILDKIKLFKIAVLKLEQNHKANNEEPYTLIQYLKDINLYVENNNNSNNDQKKEKNKNQKKKGRINNTNSIKLLTVHCAKGLEFKYVFIVGADQDTFPCISDNNDIEEERRVFYVAITRAENNCYISYSKENYTFYECKVKAKSQFIDEMNSSTWENFKMSKDLEEIFDSINDNNNICDYINESSDSSESDSDSDNENKF